MNSFLKPSLPLHDKELSSETGGEMVIKHYQTKLSHLMLIVSLGVPADLMLTIVFRPFHLIYFCGENPWSKGAG